MSAYNNQAIYIAFVNITNDGFKLYIDDIHAWINDPVSVNELYQNNAVSIYPNPTKGIFSVECESQIQKVIVSNSFGQIVFTTEQTKIDLSNYPNGIYFLKIETISGSTINKVIKN